MKTTGSTEKLPQPGIQKNGASSTPIYESCEDLLQSFAPSGGVFADVGGGRGDFTARVKVLFDATCLIDFAPEEIKDVETRAADLNSQWPAQDDEFDVTCALECIEHVENPRHFFREIFRITKSGGLVIITTPNQISIASKLCFLARSQHQHFQDSCYPAHISALLPIDLQRIALECNQDNFTISYTNSGRIPGTKLKFQSISTAAKGPFFSDNVIFSIRVTK